MAYGKSRARSRSARENELHEKLKDLEALEVLSEESEQKINEIRTEIEQIDDEKVRGLILRSGATWHEKGEKSNAYFM